MTDNEAKAIAHRTYAVLEKNPKMHLLLKTAKKYGEDKKDVNRDHYNNFIYIMLDIIGVNIDEFER